MTRLFTFDPQHYTAQYAEEGYVHIPNGLTEEFHAILAGQIEERLRENRLQNFALGNKQQALYEFPRDGNYHQQLLDGVGGVASLNPDRLVLAERHIKAYEADANPSPLAHKDRYASQVSVGFSVRVPEGSTLVLYPSDDVSVNAFNSSAELRASFSPDQLPEETLKVAQRVEIQDRERDVVMFRGNALWHLRTNPANTVMLYLKLNDFNCDPLGEDPFTPLYASRTASYLALPDGEFGKLIPVLGRRVDYVHRRYDRDWNEILGVVLSGRGHLTIDTEEMRALQAMDGRRTVAAIAESFEKIRRLASCEVIELLPEPVV